jgi:hypothetical protein
MKELDDIMRHAISHALAWVLHLLFPTWGRYVVTTPAPVRTVAPPVRPLSAWDRPWTTPPRNEDVEYVCVHIGRDDRTMRLATVQRERRLSAVAADLGIDHPPYAYPGDHFTILAEQAAARTGAHG